MNIKAWDSWLLAPPVLPSWGFLLLQLLLSHSSNSALPSVPAWSLWLGCQRSDVSSHLPGCLAGPASAPRGFEVWQVSEVGWRSPPGSGVLPQKQDSQAKSCSVPKLPDAEIQSLSRVKREWGHCHHGNCTSANPVAAQAGLNHVAF